MIQQSHSWAYIQKEENTNSKRCMHLSVHSSTVYNNHGMEANYMLIHTHTQWNITQPQKIMK